MSEFDLYKDIATRTGGDIYVGVVGPVRSGKSTFIKRFMDTVVLENIPDDNARKRANDELPQSADGKSIMTTQPKFVPNEAVRVNIAENIAVNMRMIDCVGYIVEGALGAEEDGKERLVRTPWSDEEMPFKQAAEMGTEKVIKEHSTIGLLVTTDGSICGIPRENYVTAEERVVSELKELKKPFAIILNSATPQSENCIKLKDELSEKYETPVIIKDALNMSKEDIADIMSEVLLEFPLKLVDVIAPKWIQALSADTGIVKELMDILKSVSSEMVKMRDFEKIKAAFDGASYLDIPDSVTVDAGRGRIEVAAKVKPELFLKVLSEECGHDIADDFTLMAYVRFLKNAENEYGKLKNALEQVYATGYGVVTPRRSEMLLEEPEIVKLGGQFGIRLRASAPSLHLIKVDVETEVNPTVGTEQQSGELVEALLDKFGDDKSGIWDTDIFGKSLSELMNDGLSGKLNAMPEEAKTKMRKTITKIVNEGKGGVLCILL